MAAGLLLRVARRRRAGAPPARRATSVMTIWQPRREVFSRPKARSSMSSSSSVGLASLENQAGSTTTWQVEQASEPSQAPSMSTPCLWAISSTDRPRGALDLAAGAVTARRRSWWAWSGTPSGSGCARRARRLGLAWARAAWAAEVSAAATRVISDARGSPSQSHAQGARGLFIREPQGVLARWEGASSAEVQAEPVETHRSGRGAAMTSVRPATAGKVRLRLPGDAAAGHARRSRARPAEAGAKIGQQAGRAAR